MEDMNLTVNDIVLNIKIENDRIIIKPIVDIKSLEDYSFSMNTNITVEYFLNKLDSISKGVKEIRDKENNVYESEISSSQMLRNILEKLPVVNYEELGLKLKNGDGTWKDFKEILKTYEKSFNKVN